jgi:hypothetical protein
MERVLAFLRKVFSALIRTGRSAFRAFYGWLSHCRHLRTVRKHLTGLTLDKRAEVAPASWRSGVTAEWWREQCRRLRIGLDDDLERRSEAVEDMHKELIMRVFLGGVEPALRKEVNELCY